MEILTDAWSPKYFHRVVTDDAECFKFLLASRTKEGLGAFDDSFFFEKRLGRLFSPVTESGFRKILFGMVVVGQTNRFDFFASFLPKSKTTNVTQNLSFPRNREGHSKRIFAL